MPLKASKISALDPIDREILKVLEQECRLSFTDLSSRVSLSPNAVAERLRRLERAGIITGYHAQINVDALGFPLQAYIDVKMRSDTAAEGVEHALERIPGIVQLTLTTGRFDYTLRVACSDQADLVRLIEEIRSTVPVAETYSRLVLRDRILPMRT